MTREEQIQRESEIYAWTANQFDCGLAFRKGAEWADKTMLERVCKWLKDNSHFYVSDFTGEIDEPKLIGDLKNRWKE